MEQKPLKPGKKNRQGEGGGAPKFVIDYAMTEKLSKMQCTIKEIAAVLGCCEDTLMRDKKFSDLHKKGLENGKASLRRLQWKSAEAGNVTSQIWLGKQYLGQRDKEDVDASHKVVWENVLPK